MKEIYLDKTKEHLLIVCILSSIFFAGGIIWFIYEQDIKHFYWYVCFVTIDKNNQNNKLDIVSKLKKENAVLFLCWTLRDSDNLIQRESAFALKELDDKHAVEPLIDALGDDKDGVREWAASVLGELRDKRAVRPLIKTLQDKNDWVRRATVHALLRLEDTTAIEPIKNALSVEKDVDIKEIMQSAIGKLESLSDGPTGIGVH